MSAPRFVSIQEVPKYWRSIDGAKLSLEQIETILDAAEEAEEGFAAALGIERRAFAASHVKVNGQWASK